MPTIRELIVCSVDFIKKVFRLFCFGRSEITLHCAWGLVLLACGIIIVLSSPEIESCALDLWNRHLEVLSRPVLLTYWFAIGLSPRLEVIVGVDWSLNTIHKHTILFCKHGILWNLLCCRLQTWRLCADNCNSVDETILHYETRGLLL